MVDLDSPPVWFQRHQQHDHLTADQARAFAATDGACMPNKIWKCGKTFCVCACVLTLVSVCPSGCNFVCVLRGGHFQISQVGSLPLSSAEGCRLLKCATFTILIAVCPLAAVDCAILQVCMLPLSPHPPSTLPYNLPDTAAAPPPSHAPAHIHTPPSPLHKSTYPVFL